MFLREALKMEPNDRTALAWLAQTYLQTGWSAGADDLIVRLLSTGSAAGLKAWLDSCISKGFAEDDVVPPEVDDIFLERLRKVWIQTADGVPDMPAVDAPYPGPIE